MPNSLDYKSTEANTTLNRYRHSNYYAPPLGGPTSGEKRTTFLQEGQQQKRGMKIDNTEIETEIMTEK